MKLNLRWFRYLLVILSIIIFTYTLQVFVQNFNIEKQISNLKQKQKKLNSETKWMRNYYKPFLESDYALMYFQHRAWVVWENEILFKILDDEKNNGIN